MIKKTRARAGRQRSVHRDAERRPRCARSQTAVKARTINNGQSCIAAKRFIVAESIADEFERRFVDGMASAQGRRPDGRGHRRRPAGDREDASDDLDRAGAAQRSRRGRRVLTGGRRSPGSRELLCAPTVLTDITPNSPAFREEIFGPVALLFRVRDSRRRDPLANDPRPSASAPAPGPTTRRSGSGSSTEIEAGMVFINAMVASDPRLPFGGVKHSGYGRELSLHGIREFVNIKTVWINTTQEPEQQLAPE